MEMLVALAITTLVMTLLMGTLYYAFRIRVKITDEIGSSESTARSQVWLRQVISGVFPLPADDADAFTGDAKGFSALSSLPLAPEAPLPPLRVNLGLKPNDRAGFDLLYQSGETEFVIASWPDCTVAFTYVDNTGNEVKEWQALHQPSERIPRAVRLTITPNWAGDESKLLWTFFIPSDPWIKKKPPNFFESGQSS